MGESSRAEVVQRVENLVKVPALMIIYPHEDKKMMRRMMVTMTMTTMMTMMMIW